MNGPRLSFRFHGELNDFLPPGRRNIEFTHVAGPTDTLKHIIESLGVPHTEFETSLDPSARPNDGDVVDVYPHPLPIALRDPRFVVDGHLGRLAAYLRMLGFDTWYERYADDALLASVAANEHRFLLTRDVGLLKRREVESGYCVRNHKPHDQLREVSNRFALQAQAQPFLRCMECNGQLETIPKEEIADQLPPHTRATKTDFSHCLNCGKIYWRGSHYERMAGWIRDLTAS